ncbi:type I restriction endonuclease subunit R [Vagococcus fluvialis]|uniref:type I restriction endonuclease subunit R n=1 Tax=Vagococcus fluvialis TaxID=2738 RepID=UPI003B5A1BAA
MRFEEELKLEKDLIDQLVNGNPSSKYSQWTYRDDLNTEDKLWENFKSILTEKNLAVLDGHKITDLEFEQIKNFLNFNTFYDAGKWLAGENGVAKIILQREDATLGKVALKVIDRNAILDSVYEVINQVERDKTDEFDRSRRFDITLLINGLPLVQIELKNRQHSYMDAFHQANKYAKEGKYMGIFSTLQMFVITNGSDTRYIAASHKMNPQFLTKWVDDDNQPVTKYLDFAEDVLSIPMAHRMTLQYSVLDSEKKAVILLRPYQIHAIEAVKDASKNKESGYIWHTTGSGKTLTSYKVSRNLLQIPSIDKTIFVIDRTDLDDQTSDAFTSYSEHDIIDVDSTSDTSDLIDNLYSTDRKMIVTTRQKLTTMLKRFDRWQENDRNQKKIERIKQLRIAFVVDECHRAVSAKTQRVITNFFRNSMWYGFTGTPIFDENNRKQVGDLATTTKKQYGRQLHEYTVKEAIDDKAVLGFQVEYKTTISNETLDKIVSDTLTNKKSTKNLHDLEEYQKETLVPKSVYETDEHMIEVLKSIFNESREKLGFNNGSGHTYNAILTASSIKQAQRYYELIKQAKNGELFEIDEKTKRVLPDFPKVAVTYSVTENEEVSSLNQDKMKESIADYNETFGTKFKLETIKAYNRDISERMARKKERYQLRKNQLDIVIVQNRMLTGFDAPCLSTLFIDRPPQQSYDIIQSFSRTNRLFDKPKRYGQIVTFRTPELYKRAVQSALILYSNGGESSVLAPSWEETQKQFYLRVHNIREIASCPDDVDLLKTRAEKKKFAKAYQELDKWFASLQVYTEYETEILPEKFNISENEIEEFHGKYINIIEELRIDDTGEEDDPIDIQYELESIRTEEINYEYIIALIQAFVPDDNEEVSIISDDDKREIDKYIEELSIKNSQLGTIMGQLWLEVQMDPAQFKNDSILNILNRMIEETINNEIKRLADEWHVGYKELRFFLENYRESREKQIGETELANSQDYQGYKNSTENPLSKIKYKIFLKQDIYPKVLNEVILPLRRRS